MFYVYRWTHLDSGRAYIGKGKGKRAWGHLRPSSLKSGYYFHNALLKFGVDRFRLDFLAEGLTEAEALAAEVRFIAEQNTKRPGGFNLTRGGDGVSGLEHTVASKAKMSAATRGRKCAPEAVAQRGAAISATYLTDEGREIQSGKSTKMWATADQATKERMIGARWRDVKREPCPTFFCQGTLFNGKCSRCATKRKGVPSLALQANICFLTVLGATNVYIAEWCGVSVAVVDHVRKTRHATYYPPKAY